MNRLFEIVYLLLDKRQMTAGELAEHFEVSVRTIYRDIELLCQSNIPIYSSKGRNGGIGLMESFVLNKSVLSEAEKNEILWALQGMDAVQAADNGPTIQKLKSLFGDHTVNWVQIDFTNWNNKRKEEFEQLKQAVLQKQVLMIHYFNTQGEEGTRYIEPLQLCFKNHSWYLRAYCREAEGIRLFKLNRIREIKRCQETFMRELIPETGNDALYEWTPKQEDRILIQCRIAASQAFRVYDEFDDEQIIKQADGSFLVTWNCFDDAWLYRYILSYGAAIKVLAPELICRKFKSELLKLLDIYQENEEENNGL